MNSVWEWCRDAYHDRLPGGTDPEAPAATHRVVRGGSWDDYAQGCRSAYRDWSVPGHRGDYLGFRLAAVPTSQQAKDQ